MSENGVVRTPTPSWMRVLSTKKILVLLLLLVTAVSVRILTLQFMRTHLYDPAWFQMGSYAKFDRQARDILAGNQHLFLINDPTRTDLVQYPPAFPWLVALIYTTTGNHSPYSVQIVQWLLDLIVSLVLIAGITITAFGWRVGIVAAFLAGLSPLLGMYGAGPVADAPTMWFVLGGNWLLLLAAKRTSVWCAAIAGVLLGIACWLRVNPLYLSPAWAIALIVFARAGWKTRLTIGAAVVFGTTITIAPIVVRNYVSFPDFTPTGGTIGANVWEGLGETELGRNNGFVFGDDNLIKRDRIKMDLPADFPIDLQWPDGIRRDRERVQESLNFIKEHPVWYAGVMLKRMWGMLKVAGAPLPYYGSAGINVTSRKCLPAAWQGGVVGIAVNFLGSLQSVVRYLFLPFVALGIYVASRSDLATTGLLIVTVAYYLIPGTAAHTEIRYMLPMHAVLTVFSGVGVIWLGSRAGKLFRRKRTGRFVH